MVWDHREGHHPFYGIALQQYDQAQESLVGESKIIFKGSKIGLTEGPHMYKRDGFYYLLTAEGGTEYDHAVTLARSKEILGPYEVHPQNPILTSNGDESLVLQKLGTPVWWKQQRASGTWRTLCGRPIPGTRRCNLGRETALQSRMAREWMALPPDSGKFSLSTKLLSLICRPTHGPIFQAVYHLIPALR